MKHRQTYLNMYEECKYLFYRTVINGEVPVSAPARDLGSVVHEAIRRILQDGETNLEAAIVYAMNKLKETEGIPYIDEESVRIARWMTKKAREIAQSISPDLIEEYIEFKNIDENNTLSSSFHSQVDIFDKKTLTIYDWKTGRLKAKKRQLYIYAYMLKRKYGIIAKKGVFIYLRNGKTEEFEISMKDIEDAEKWVKETIAEVESKLENLLFDDNWEAYFPPTPNTRCKTCPFSLECTKVLSTNAALQLENYIKSPDEIEDTANPGAESAASNSSVATYDKDDLDLKRLIKDMEDDPETARLLGAEIIRQESVLKAMKNALKKFVENNGAVQVDSKVFDINESTSWAFNEEEKRSMASEILSVFGLNPWKYFELSSTSKAALQRDKNMTDADIENFLRKYGTQKKSKRFGCRTVNETSAKEAG